MFLTAALPAMGADNEDSVQWGRLFGESLFFLGTEHAFRIATDPSVRAGFKGSFLGGYINSVDNLHGWADGDPFLVNYVGHPMQGSVSGDIWIHNDLRYRTAEIGRSRRYWTGRLRAIAFAWAYSEQFEIGPISEASIGHVQSRYPQQGFVDHVITPTIGGAWMIAEDAVDRFVIRRIEAHTRSPLGKILARGVLNPSRSFANCMELELPWYRETRGSVFGSDPVVTDPPAPGGDISVITKTEADPGDDRLPSFEFTTSFNSLVGGASGRHPSCAGGGGSGLFNLNPILGFEVDVAGCKLLGLDSTLSGDLLTFAAGPRFSYRNSSRWTPWMNVLVGGEKLSEEWFSPELKAAVLAAHPDGSPDDLHSKYTRDFSATGLKVSVGGGLDWSLNRVVAFRALGFEYSRVFMGNVNGIGYPESLQMTTGLVLRMQ